MRNKVLYHVTPELIPDINMYINTILSSY